MSDLAKQLKEEKDGRTMAQIKTENVKEYYYIKSLASKVSAEKAKSNGNFLTKDHLVEYKGLIIFLLKKANYRGYMNLKESMTDLLNVNENDKIVYKTQRGIKGIVSRMAIQIGLENSEKNLRAENGICITTNTYGNAILENFTQFRLNTLM